MERIQEYVNMGWVKGYVSNPYFAGVLGIVLVVYIGFMSHKLPTEISVWLMNPIFKLVVVFALMGIHRYKPIWAVVSAVAFMVILGLLTFHRSMSKEQEYQQPGEAEVIQLKQEIDQGIPVAEMAPADDYSVGLHPKNRPTPETGLGDQRVIDPNDPAQPGNKIIQNPYSNTAVYELNPPFAINGEPQGKDVINTPMVNLPPGGPTRYSAMHGYALA